MSNAYVIVSGVIAFALMMVLVIGFHELGHWLVARAFNIQVKRIAIGFGRPIFKYQSAKQVEWVFGWLPLGGYISLLDTRKQAVKKNEKIYAYDMQPLWVRFSVLIAGVMANIFFAFLAFSLALLMGINTLKPVVETVSPKSLAYDAGLESGDIIEAVNGWQTPNWSLALLNMAAHLGDKSPLQITVQRPKQGLKSLEINLNASRLTSQNSNFFTLLGISPNRRSLYQWQNSFIEAPLNATRLTFQYLLLNSLVIIKLFTAKISLSVLAGPIALIEATTFSFLANLTIFLYFLALLSIAVAIANCLPLPALDGGQILLLGLEKLRGKPLTVAVESLITRLGYIFLFVIFMQLLANDLARMS